MRAVDVERHDSDRHFTIDGDGIPLKAEDRNPVRRLGGDVDLVDVDPRLSLRSRDVREEQQAQDQAG